MMNATIRGWVLACLAGALVGCGGGGGDDGGGIGGGSESTPQAAVPQTVTGPSWLTFSPNRIDLELKYFRSKDFSFDLTSTRVIEGPISIQVRSQERVILSFLRVEELKDGVKRVKLTTDPGLDRGTHTGVLEIRLCKDLSFTRCDEPIDAPWYLPYRFVVSD